MTNEERINEKFILDWNNEISEQRDIANRALTALQDLAKMNELPVSCSTEMNVLQLMKLGGNVESLALSLYAEYIKRKSAHDTAVILGAKWDLIDSPK